MRKKLTSRDPASGLREYREVKMDIDKHPGAATSSDLPSWMRHALSAFEADSTAACRALQVSMAVKVFGVGILLPNNLAIVPDTPPKIAPR